MRVNVDVESGDKISTDFIPAVIYAGGSPILYTGRNVIQFHALDVGKLNELADALESLAHDIHMHVLAQELSRAE